MMGRQPKVQKKMFYTKFNLDRRIRQDHILRKINKHINFDFIYDQVKDTYGSKGNVSVPPPVILKMMLLLILYNVRSERELMATIPERLDWLWFLGYDLDDSIPDHKNKMTVMTTMIPRVVLPTKSISPPPIRMLRSLAGGVANRN